MYMHAYMYMHIYACIYINADDDLNWQGELGGGNGNVRGNGDHEGEGAEGGGGDGTDSNIFDGNGFHNAERDGLDGGGLEIYRLKVKNWLPTLHVRQWQRVNYGI